MKRKLIPRKKTRKASGKKSSQEFRLRFQQRPEIILILKKLVTNTHPSSDQRWLSYGRLKRLIKIDGYEMNKPLSGLLLCRLIISLAERLCAKFPSPSRPRFSAECSFADNLSAALLIRRHSSRPKGFIRQLFHECAMDMRW